MKNGILVALAVVLLMVGSIGCSSSSSGGPSQQALIESNVETVMSVAVGIIQGFDPFPPGLSPELGDCSVIPENDDLCNDGGTIQDCGSGLFTFNNCTYRELTVSIELAGSLTFTQGTTWPTGTRTLTLDGAGDLAATYQIMFDGTDMADVIYSDASYDANCTVDLNDPVVASCTLIE